MASEHWLCITCGVQSAARDGAPARCAICDEERQYVNPNGQQWMSLARLRETHHNLIRAVADGVVGIATEPHFAIGQQAHLLRTPHGNVLWDCISLLDEPTIAAVRGLGGIAAIAISHPHFYSSMVEWARAFDAPIWLHADDADWVMRPDERICHWSGERQALLPGVTLIRCGGHFAGAAVLHWAAGAEGRGALFTGDTIQVVADRRWVTFMYSYPNLIPVNAATVRRIVAAVAPFPYARLYGGWWGRVVEDAPAAVARSAERYIARIS